VVTAEHRPGRLLTGHQSETLDTSFVMNDIRDDVEFELNS